MQRFIEARIASLQFPAENVLRIADEWLHTYAFSGNITSQKDQLLIANILDFLEYLLGEKFEISQLPGYRDSMVYREPGRVLQQSFYTWLVNNALSLTTNRLLQSFQIWLNQVSTAQLLLHIEHSTSLAASQTQPLMIRDKMFTFIRSGKPPEREMQALFSVVNSVQQQLFHERAIDPVIQYETLNQFLSSPDSLSRIFVLPQSEVPDKIDESPQPRFLFEREFERTQKTVGARHNHPAWKMAEYLEFIYTRLPLSAAYQSEAVAGDSPPQHSASAMPSGLESTPADRLMHLGWPAALRGIEQWVEEKRRADPAFQVVLPPSGGFPRSALLQRTKQIDDQEFSEKTLAPLLNRELVKSSAPAREDAADEEEENFPEAFTFLRKTVPARPPQQSYAYARPLQPVKAEESVIKTQQRREVVEIVRKEVDMAMNAGSIIDNLTRADLSHLADQVYSSLTRKLLMEKERLGLGS